MSSEGVIPPTPCPVCAKWPLKYHVMEGVSEVCTLDVKDTRFTPTRGFLPHSDPSRACEVTSLRGPLMGWVGLSRSSGEASLPVLASSF